MADDGYLPISNAMGRDIDSGKAAGRDVADFLPDDVAQELYDQTTSARAPVHAENLIPISPSEGAAMRQIDPESGSLPRFPATRRVIPAPFQRDCITGGSHGKAWTLVTADQIRKGDIIPDLGLVVDVQDEVRREKIADLVAPEDLQNVSIGSPEGFAAAGTQHIVTGAGGKVVTFPSHAEVKVFRGRSSQ